MSIQQADAQVSVTRKYRIIAYKTWATSNVQYFQRSRYCTGNDHLYPQYIYPKWRRTQRHLWRSRRGHQGFQDADLQPLGTAHF